MMLSRLKSLELHGYKTFASRTLFEFADNITCIVGPNGSGKSNIADSMRWVLGEQSYSLLRGKKTEDMIFSGSEQRSRAGMASATITFDNVDNWLPIDFSEVAITRRAYRDGTNEYLINGQRVRLKDVSEMLAQSGLAERTYTIIGQGLVDAALALKAEERRRLFEEAAGIGLYRTRREEALRRLDTTRRNLERVQDILAELQPRLRSLERQAKRAQEYDQVRSDLKVLLREWYGYHWHKAQIDLAESMEIAHQRETSLDQTRREQFGLDEQVGDLHSKTQSLRARLNSWHRQMAELHTQREAVIRSLAVADERERSYHEQSQNLDIEAARQVEEQALFGDRLVVLKQELAAIEDDLQEARNQVEQARAELTASQAERRAIEEKLQSARHESGSLNQRQNTLQARQIEMQNQRTRNLAVLEQTQKAATAAEAEFNQAVQHLQSALKARELALEQLKKAETDLQTHQEKLLAVNRALQQARERMATHQGEQARLKARLDVLVQAENAFTGYGEGAKLLLQAAGQARLSGARQALSNQLEVPEELETAISAALGDYLDAVLLDHSLDEALDLLSGAAKRGVLLPIDAMKPAVNLPVMSDISGWLGIAATLVRAPAELRPIVNLLLGQVVLVSDRSAARRVLGQLAVQDASGVYRAARAVTLTGEVFYASGPVVAGAGERQGQDLLSRPRQRKDLNEQIEAARQRYEQQEREVADLRKSQVTLQEDEQYLRQAVKDARRIEDQAAQLASREQNTKEQAERQSRWQKEQARRLQTELEDSAQQLEQLAAEIKLLDEQLIQARAQVRLYQGQLDQMLLEELQDTLAHWSTRQAVAERAMQDGQARLQDLTASIARNQNTHNQLILRKQEITSSLTELETGRETSRAREGELAAEIIVLEQIIQPAEIELVGLEEKQTALQTVQSSARQALSAAEHNHAQARIQLARRQEALETLRHRIEEDFGLVAFEYEEEVSGPTPLPLDGMVEQLPVVHQLSIDIDDNLKRQRAQLRRMGPINPEAQSEYKEVSQRFVFMNEQLADLAKAEADIHEVIRELDGMMQREFRKTFDAVAVEFRQIFTRLFGGGSARLVLTNEDDLANTGIDIEARLPGRRTQGLSLLSGGERSLTATALVFSLLKVSPTPFCVLDEVDAMLDESNVGRFRELLRELSRNTQFVVVTHNRNTVQAADVIYGVTMGRDSASQVLSLKLDQVSQVVGEAA